MHLPLQRLAPPSKAFNTCSSACCRSNEDVRADHHVSVIAAKKARYFGNHLAYKLDCEAKWKLILLLYN